jgi:hypothetical protein
VAPHHTRQSEVHPVPPRSNSVSETERDRVLLTKAFTEIYELLEEYAPPWYTEEHHERVKAALSLLRKAS